MRLRYVCVRAQPDNRRLGRTRPLFRHELDDDELTESEADGIGSAASSTTSNDSPTHAHNDDGGGDRRRMSETPDLLKVHATVGYLKIII